MSQESSSQTDAAKSPLENLPQLAVQLIRAFLLALALQFLTALAAISLLMFFAVRYGRQIFEAFTKAVGIQPAQGILAVATIGFAVGAFEFKRRYLWWYAIIETAFGVVAVFTVSKGIHPASWSLVQLVSLAGCVYIIVRGLGNFAEARRRKTRKTA